MVKIQAQQLILSKYADFTKDLNFDYGSPDSNFKYVTKEYDTEDPNLLKENEILVETLYLSNDPAQKGWFTPYKSYFPVTPLGNVAPASGIGKVLKSNSDRFKEGDYISGLVGWSTHNIITGTQNVNVLDPTKVSSLTHYISVFGSTTITAYLAAFKYSGAKPEEEGKTWLVTGAAGAVGAALIQILDQLFKPKKIIAVAGGPEKVKYVKSLGDKVVVVDYKSDSYNEDFKKAVGDDLIDYFVDQVGGSILNGAFPYLADFATVVQVGAISTYNSRTPFNFSNYAAVITKRLTIKGMVIVDDIPEFPKIVGHLIKEFQAGKLEFPKFKETIVDASDDFKKVPELWTGLFKGANTGKYITKVHRGSKL